MPDNDVCKCPTCKDNSDCQCHKDQAACKCPHRKGKPEGPKMDNDARRDRVRTLISNVNAYQLDAQSHQANFINISDQAYGALQDYLKSRGMKTTDELLEEVITALPPDEQEKIRARLHELEPKKGLEFLLQPSELAKFLLFAYLMPGIKILVMPCFYQAKAWFLASCSRILLEVTRTGTAFFQDLAKVECQTLLEGLQVEQEALGTEIVSMKNIAGVEMGEAEAVVLNTASKMTVLTRVFIAIGVVAFVGIYVWQYIEEGNIADELHERIAKVATARLDAQVARRHVSVHTDQMSSINMLLQAIQDDNKAVQDFVKKNFADTIAKALTTINDDNTYEMLVKVDADSKADTREDPCLCEMKRRKIEDAKKNLPSRPVST